MCVCCQIPLIVDALMKQVGTFAPPLFEALEARFPQLTGLAAQDHVCESEGRLRTELKQVEVKLRGAVAAQTRRLLGGLAVRGIVFKLADLLIGP